MTRSTDPRLPVVERWYKAYDEHDLEALCEMAAPDMSLVPATPVLNELAGATFHGHTGLRTVAEWSWENYPALRLDGLVTKRVPGWILGSATYVLDGASTNVTDTLFDVREERIQRIRTFRRDSLAFEAATSEPVLTAREREILQLLAGGMTSPEIAQQLFLSPATVRTHVQNAVARLGAHTRLQAVSIAVKRGEIQV